MCGLLPTDLRPQKQMAVRVEPVAARPPDLLDVALEAARHVVVDDGAHVRLVEAHAERDRRHDDTQPVRHEGVLYATALGRRHAGVVTVGCPHVRVHR